MKVALDINDVGRVALGGTIGPEIGQVEGTLLEPPGEEYVLAVSQVHFLRGGYQTWTGERVRISKQHVGRLSERRLHKGRSYALAAVIAGGLVAVVVSKDLIGLGSLGENTPGDTNTSLVFRGRRRP